MKRAMQVLLVLLGTFTLAGTAVAQQNEIKAVPDALLRLLQSKGILSEAEIDSIRHAPSAADHQQQLAKLLLSKGVITQQEYDQTVPETSSEDTQSPTPQIINAAMGAPVMPAGLSPASAAQTQPPPKPEESKVIPAVAPMRVLPITVPKKGGLLPDIKLGSGASLRPYGFFKASAINQTASHGGPTFGSNDFPQGPLLLGDTGPDADPQFHIKDRALRAGVDFEWPDAAPNLTLPATPARSTSKP